LRARNLPNVHDAIIRKLREHSNLNASDVAIIRRLPHTERKLASHEDVVRQGDRPTVSAVVFDGMVARYHTLATGKRQYLSFHITGDMPDVQALFIDTMDHAVCALDAAVVSLIPHSALLPLLQESASVAFAVWRETLIDAAIFREAITNNSARPPRVRLAHLFCEQYYRARAGNYSHPGSCSLPLSQTQLGETLGLSLPTVSRALQWLRRLGVVDFHRGELRVRNWQRLAAVADFDPSYLHLRKPPEL